MQAYDFGALLVAEDSGNGPKAGSASPHDGSEDRAASFFNLFRSVGRVLPGMEGTGPIYLLRRSLRGFTEPRLHCYCRLKSIPSAVYDARNITDTIQTPPMPRLDEYRVTKVQSEMNKISMMNACTP